MTESRLPDFIIVGAVKAATTWIAHQLRQHPALFLPGPEPHFFSTEYERGEQWYANLFGAAPAGHLVGEKSADYLGHPDSARRISDLLPSVRLIAQLRNPVERAYSDYCMLFRRGAVGADFEQCLTGSNATSARFLNDGLYADHLSRFLDRFPREQLLVLLHDDIKVNPRSAITEVCRHVGVAIHINDAALTERKNDSRSPLLPLPLRRALKPFKKAAAPVRNQAWFRAMHRALARPVSYPSLTAGLRARLCDYYVRDIQELGRLLGRDMSHWLGDVSINKSA